MTFNSEFKELLASSRSALLARTTDSLVNTDSFRRLLALLQTSSTKADAELFTIVLDSAYLEKIDFTEVQKNLYQLIMPELQLRNHFIVDENFKILSAERYTFSSSSEARHIYNQISLEDKCVVIVGKYTAFPHYFYKGVDIGEATFFTELDYRRFKGLRDISQVIEVIDEFRDYIRQYSIYAGFFVPKSTLRSMYGQDASRNPYAGRSNILRNKPEDHLRQSLKNYLTEHINRSFNFFRETQMDNTARRLDIIGEDEKGCIYFFEVKWIGDSIAPDDNRIATSYDQDRVLEGVEQTLQYIQEWQNNRRVVNLGCLVVFDARNDKFDYETLEHNESFQDYLNAYASSVPKFRKIADLLLDNVHPC